MINLIPPAARRAVIKEYWIRVCTVWFFLITFAALSVTILKTPTLMVVLAQSAQYSDAMSAAAKEQEASELSEASIESANRQAIHLMSSASSTPFSVVMRELRALSGTGVVIKEFTLNRTEGTLGTIMITGIADSRSALTGFNDAIKAHPLFTDAVLPIANLAQDRDINFQITITAAETKVAPAKKP